MSNSKFLDKTGLQKVIDKIKEKANKTEIPTTLPANGGNAETVGNYTPAQLTQSNPNLLDNPDFRINQRGKTEYTYGVSVTTVNRYTVDRWMSTGTVKVLVGGGIEFTHHKENTWPNGDTYTDLAQYTEYTDVYSNETVTFSFCINGKIYSVTGKAAFSKSFVIDGHQIELISYAIGIPYYIIRLRGSEDYTVTVSWMKLELGSVATPFVPPNPAEELLKCMRYYQIANYKIPIVAVNISAGCFFGTHLQVSMRTTPSIILPTYDTTMALVSSGVPNSYISGWSAGSSSAALNNSEFQLNLINSDTSVYSNKLIYAGTMCPIAFSADL